MAKPKSSFSDGLTVSLVVNNGEKYLLHCLNSLAQQTYDNFFLLIIDNASIDNSRGMITIWLKDHPTMQTKTRLIVNKKNLGFCKAHNQAFRWSGSKYFCILNQDVILRSNYFRLLIDFLNVETKIASVQGKLLSWNFTNSQNYSKNLFQPVPSQEIIDTCGLVVYKRRQVANIGQGVVDVGQFDHTKEIFGVAGVAPIYRRQALQAVEVYDELFDENFFAYKEDIDLAWRLQQIGFKSFIVAGAVGYHDRSLKEAFSIVAQVRQRRRWSRLLKMCSYRNHILLLFKNDCLNNFLRHSPYIFWYELKKAGYMLLFEPVIFLRSWGQVLKLLIPTWRKRRFLSNRSAGHCLDIRRWFI